jgi:hypothetical protein
MLTERLLTKTYIQKISLNLLEEGESEEEEDEEGQTKVEEEADDQHQRPKKISQSGF